MIDRNEIFLFEGSENEIDSTLLTAISRLITKSYVEQLVAFGIGNAKRGDSFSLPLSLVVCVRLQASHGNEIAFGIDMSERASGGKNSDAITAWFKLLENAIVWFSRYHIVNGLTLTFTSS